MLRLNTTSVFNANNKQYEIFSIWSLKGARIGLNYGILKEKNDKLELHCFT